MSRSFLCARVQKYRLELFHAPLYLPLAASYELVKAIVATACSLALWPYTPLLASCSGEDVLCSLIYQIFQNYQRTCADWLVFCKYSTINMAEVETFGFQAEITQLLDLIISALNRLV